MKQIRLAVGAVIVRFGFWVASGQWRRVEATIIPKEKSDGES